MKFKHQLKEALRGILIEDELDLLPRGFQTIGPLIIIKLKPELIEKREIIGEKYLELLPSIESVYLNEGIIQGQFRKPENIVFLVGEDNPIVTHKEHGVIYKFDITKIMFSKGNLSERKYLATLVQDDEIIVDMFAGIGYFSLPIAEHANPKKIYSIELNPDAYHFLVENIKLNDFEDIITPINGNCNEEVLKLSDSGVLADRIIMGVFPAPSDYVENALTLVKDKGTIFHYEGVVEKERHLDLFWEFEEVTKGCGFSASMISKRLVKSYGPNLYHTVIDVLVEK